MMAFLVRYLQVIELGKEIKLPEWNMSVPFLFVILVLNTKIKVPFEICGKLVRLKQSESLSAQRILESSSTSCRTN